MSTTTTALIRQSMVDTVLDLIPDALAPSRYLEHRNVMDYTTFCEANPGRAFRLFEIRDTFEHEPPVVSNTDVEEVRTVMECRIGYPHDNRYGDKHALNRDDVMNQDLRQVRNAIGVNGYATIEAAADACILGETYSVERGTACDFIVLRLNTQYWETMP